MRTENKIIIFAHCLLSIRRRLAESEARCEETEKRNEERRREMEEKDGEILALREEVENLKELDKIKDVTSQLRLVKV